MACDFSLTFVSSRTLIFRGGLLRLVFSGCCFYGRVVIGGDWFICCMFLYLVFFVGLASFVVSFFEE